MGNEQGKLQNLIIETSAVESTDFWSLYNAEVDNETNGEILSVFKGEPLVSGQLWISQNPFERAIKNFRIFRHPSIIKYVNSWENGSQKYLATERCRPLSLVIIRQSDIQICLGLKTILKGLIFLVEKANAKHLNICISSIYVNAHGEWKLGGFEHVWQGHEVTKNLIDKTKPYRYSKAIDLNEIETEGKNLEQYSFAVLCEEVLKDKNFETPYIGEFKDYCAIHLKHKNILMRPQLSAVLLHPYFNHEFVLIHSFLTELPLKSASDKQEFFTSVIDRLRYFDEGSVASQIGNMLLSRMVLLDPTAQLCVTPYVLRTKSKNSAALFSNQTFSLHIIPKIKQIFHVRDAQIRLILLEYFEEYVNLFNKDELQDQILPQLLLGIKDTNDFLVSKTLRCLADLIPILGSKIVVGGKQERLFADGRPQGPPDTTRHWVEPRSITPVITSGDYILSASPLPENTDISESYTSLNTQEGINMIERLSPDGGEDVQLDTNKELDEVWSDWENNDLHNNEFISPKSGLDNKQENLVTNTNTSINKVIVDINELDIKTKKIIHSENEEIDFFKDMEPNIEISKHTLPEAIGEIVNNPVCAKFTEDIKIDQKMFEMQIENDFNENGWDIDSNDWTNE